MRNALGRLGIHDPGLASLRSAARAAIVMPAVFAFADKVIGNPQVATFAAFGSFAMLVLVEFGGPMRTRLIAYVSLACVGAANITLGTFCSRNAWLAAGAMAIVGFTILFSGVISGYFAAAATSAMLTFILSATIRAPFSALPDRLEGWALAAGAGICAQMLLWPVRPHSTLRRDAAAAARALADLAEAELESDRTAMPQRTKAAGESVRSLRQGFAALPGRRTGPMGPRAALSGLIDELAWLLPFLAPPGEPPALHVCAAENADALAAVVATLRAAANRLDGGDADPGLARLDETRDALARALAQQLPGLPTIPDDEALEAAVEPAFRIRLLSGGARQVALAALAATGDGPPETRRPLLSVLSETERLTAEQLSVRSVWFRNSVRGAAGLAIAVFIAQRSGLQHAFWVVLGTLSVLRSNALGTGWSIVSALGGTAVGIVLGAALVLGIGTNETVLWIVLPFAVLLGSYAPRAISFAAGQAAFTVVLFVLFNLIQPTGWRVGLLRIEDVAIGFAISLGVGLLFWPRGAGALLRENLAYAFARNADYVVAAENELVDGHDPAPTEHAAQAAAAAEHRLDEAFRQYLTERSTVTVDRDALSTLVAGAGRVRRVAQSLSALAEMSGGAGGLDGCSGNLDAEAHALRSWYVTLGDSLQHDTAVPPPHVRDADGRRRLLECVRDAVTDDGADTRAALDLLWASEHLDVLWRLEQHLRRHAAAATPASRTQL